MRFLTSKSTVLKGILIILSPFLAAMLGIIIATHQPVEQVKAQTQEVDVQCIAEGLTTYMNTIIEGAGDLDKIKLLSPAFNITSNTEAAIFDAMVEGASGVSADFAKLDGFAANSYSHVPGGGSQYLSYEWFSQPIYGTSWKERFNNMPVIFTEYGDFNYAEGAGKSANIATAADQHNQTAADGTVLGINYFNAIPPGNPDFTRHNLSSDEYNQVTGGGASKAGVNSAKPVTPDKFVNEASAYSSNVHWVVEISLSQGDVNTVVSYTRNAYAHNMTPVLRICIGNACDFANPTSYINFLREVNRQLTVSGTKPLWVIAGPNEPEKELWATPGCIKLRPEKIYEIACNAVNPNDEPDYHSLRPFPANPCNKVQSGTSMCGNDLMIQETVEVEPSDGFNCRGTDPQICSFIIQSSVEASINLANAQLPIMGNTQLVPNSINPIDQLPFPQRLTDYVSWYLNGVVQRAEERFFRVTSTTDLRALIDFSGPLRKTLPFAIQNGDVLTSLIGPFPIITGIQEGLRLKQDNLIGTERHNQTVECGPYDTPEQCYSTAAEQNRLQEIAAISAPPAQGINRTQSLDYIPYSSTEDRVGSTTMSIGSGSFTQGDVDISGLTFTPTGTVPKNLYFAHMQESKELGGITQSTFVPRDQMGNIDKTKTEDVSPPEKRPFCEYEDTRTNAGDDLYGDVKKEGIEEEPPLKGVINYTAEFDCEFPATSRDEGIFQQCLAEGFCSEIISCNGNWQPDSGCSLGRSNWGRCFGDIGFCNSYAYTPPKCQKLIGIPLLVSTQTPEADSVWNRLVAGPWSVFRRFFPKTGPGTPVDKIKDIPAITNASYSAAGQAGSSGHIISTTALAGDNKPGDSANLYFPHIGGISDYFLNGIQKALLPFGGELPQDDDGDDQTDDKLPNCEEVPDSAIPAKYLARKTIFIDLATRQNANGATNNAARCYNDVVRRSLAAGINPFFSLTIWFNESDASNYAASPLPWEDFGIHTAGEPEDFNAQITLFLSLAKNGAYQASYPQCFSAGFTDMQAFMFIFHEGSKNCLTNDLVYYKAIFGTSSTTRAANGPWNWVSGSSCIPQYPDDMSCP